MKLKSLIILSLMFVFSSVSFAVHKPDLDVYGVLSETFSGVVADSPASNVNSVKFNNWQYSLFNMGEIKYSTSAPTDIIEGEKCIKVENLSGDAKYGAIGVDVTNYDGILDMSNYANGKIKMLIKGSSSSMSKLKIGFLYNKNRYYKLLEELAPSFSYDNTWQEVVFPLSNLPSEVTLSKVTSVLYLSIGGSGEQDNYVEGATIEFDNIRWEKPNVGSGMALNMFKVEDDTEIPGGNSFSFDVNIDEGIHWKVANEYIKINFNYSEYNPCYIKIYTDNTSEKANPKYTGTETNPAGLINVDDTKVKLDMCWRVSGSIIDKNNLKIYQYYKDGKPYLSDKENEGNCYLWMQDLAKHEPDFDNKYSYVWNNGSEISYRGAQFGEYTFEAPAFPLYLYLGANFLNTVTDENYSTNTLTVELLYE